MIEPRETEFKPSRRELFQQIEAIWREHHQPLLRRARNYARGDWDLAESFLSRTTLKVLNYAATTDRPIKNFGALFYVSLKHIAADHWRKTARQRREQTALENEWPDDALRDTLDILIAADELLQVARASTHLTRPLRQLLEMHAVKGLSYSEISASLEISESLARKRMQLARSKLRDLTRDDPSVRNVKTKVHVSRRPSSNLLNNTSIGRG